MGYMRDVPSYRVECKRRIILIRLPEFAIRQKTELHKRLEAIADTTDKSLTHIQEIHDRFPDSGTAHECSYELSRSIGLVRAGEPAWDEQYLAIPDSIGK